VISDLNENRFLYDVMIMMKAEAPSTYQGKPDNLEWLDDNTNVKIASPY
jgi:hypothetical protein